MIVTMIMKKGSRLVSLKIGPSRRSQPIKPVLMPTMRQPALMPPEMMDFGCAVP